MLLILADLAVLLEALDLVLGIAAGIAHGNAAVLGSGLALLDDLATTFLGGSGERQANDAGTIVIGRDAQIGGEDGLLDRAEQGLVPRLDGHEVALGNLDGTDLRDGRCHAIVVDLHVIEDAGRGTTRVEFTGNQLRV